MWAAACETTDQVNLITGPEVGPPQYTVVATEYTYTLDADFDEGVLVSVNHDTPNNDQLQLNGPGRPFNFIWVAASNRGTIVKIDTNTGDVLGEYRSAPEGRGLNPSRTTVDANGNVWSGNRNEVGYLPGGAHGSVVKIGLEENNQCVDRNGDGIITTSTGLGDILAWPDVTDGVGSTDGAIHLAQVQDAVDECILIYQRTPDAENVRHVSVDANNDVWIGGYPFTQRKFHKLAGSDGAILDSFDARLFRCGGYGGLIDGNNVLWSASISQSRLLRYDLDTSTGSCIVVPQSYGLGIDTNGFIWNSTHEWSARIAKVSPTGVVQLGFPRPNGGSYSRGVAVTSADNHVWVANSLSDNVTRLDNSGGIVSIVSVGSGSYPTGVAIDGAGMVWVTNLQAHNVMRIDPATNAVDLTVSLGAGAGPYNYSDMTGAFTPSAPTDGNWTVIQDGGADDTPWGRVTWNTEPEGSEPAGTSITVQVRVANTEAGLAAEPWLTVSNGDVFDLVGRFIEVQALLHRDDPNGDSPVLSDLTIELGVIDVDIDIKPGSWPNSISLQGKTSRNGKGGTGISGTIPVAILTTAEFDAATVDVTTVTFGDDDGNDIGVNVKNNGALHASLEDVDGDGDVDLVMHFSKTDLVDNGDLHSGTTELFINGETLDGRLIHGVDAVRVIH
jgi:hypothetical protein